MMSEWRIIKRYPNRRLYDMETSAYITLDEIRALVLNQIKFKVIDNKTNEDLTNYILLQIISEQENGKLPIFTRDMLEGMIRFYGNPLQQSLSQFLEKCFSFLPEDKRHLEAYMKTPPFTAIAEFTQRNVDLWQSVFQQYTNKETKPQTAPLNKRKRKTKKSTS